jgi:hypothetical protein
MVLVAGIGVACLDALGSERESCSVTVACLTGAPEAESTTLPATELAAACPKTRGAAASRQTGIVTYLIRIVLEKPMDS